jgi:chromosome partitioning protein
MYILSFVNPKGGTGKTTAALLLAEQIAKAGGKTAVLDLDPNGNIVAWGDLRAQAGRSVPFAIQARPPDEDVIAAIDALAGVYDYLVLDLEGSKDQIVTYALSRTDLCIIPLDGSPMEARQAAQAVKLVQTTARMIRKTIPYALLFTRTNAAFQSADERDVRHEMTKAGICVLPIRLARRAPYTRIFREGLLLDEIYDQILQSAKSGPPSAQDKAQKQIMGAVETARAYAQAVFAALDHERGSDDP